MAGGEVERHHAPSFGVWVAGCFTLNYIVGSGFLTLPLAFMKAGYLLGLLVLFLFAVYAIFAVTFLLEVGERARILATVDGISRNIRSYHKNYHSITTSDHGSLQASPSPNADVGEPEKIVDPDHKFEIPELCSIFLGDSGKRFYVAFIVTYLYGVLWAYSAVFAASFAAHLPLPFLPPAWHYHVYLVVFAAVELPLSQLELTEQVPLQVFLTLMRVVMLVVMVLTVLVAYFSGEPQFGDLSHDYHGTLSEHPDRLFLLLTIAAYAFIFHHSTPSIAHPVANKKGLPKMFFWAILFCYVAYSAVGSLVSLYFGHHVQPSSNLCWQTYVGHLNADGSIPLYAHAVSFFVVIFPALDVASAFPLNALTLGNNMMVGYFGQDMCSVERDRRKLTFFRLLASLPPILGAAVERKLDRITSYTGLAAFAIMFLFPPLLSHYSARHLEAESLPADTIHSSFYTRTWAQLLVAGSGGVVLIMVVVGLLTEHSSSS